MGRKLSTDEINGLPIPKEIQSLMKEIISRIDLLGRETAGNIELAYWRGRQEFDEEGIRKQIRAKLNAEIRIELGSKAFEQGKEQEREKIFKEIEERNAVRPYPHTGIVLEEPVWQALKEGK